MIPADQGDDPHADRAKPPGTLLLVDDEPENLRLGLRMLRGDGFEVLVATNGADGLRIAAAVRPDLILLDVRMPGLDGIGVCTRLRADPGTCAIPVIFVSALAQIDDKARGFGAGGVDYITKPFDARELLLRVVTHLRLARGNAAPAPPPVPDAVIDAPATGADHRIRLLLHARDMLCADLRSPPSIDELARLVGTNRTTLTELFRTHLGTSVMGHLREQRLQQARRRLQFEDASMAAIAQAVGYRNARDLARACKGRFGVTPTELRRGGRD